MVTFCHVKGERGLGRSACVFNHPAPVDWRQDHEEAAWHCRNLEQHVGRHWARWQPSCVNTTVDVIRLDGPVLVWNPFQRPRNRCLGRGKIFILDLQLHVLSHRRFSSVLTLYCDDLQTAFGLLKAFLALLSLHWKSSLVLSPFGENTELKCSPFIAWSRSVYSHMCYAYSSYCLGFLSCLLLPFQFIHLHFFQNLSRYFHSCVGPPKKTKKKVQAGNELSNIIKKSLHTRKKPLQPGRQNKIGHPAGCRFLCWVPAEYK